MVNLYLVTVKFPRNPLHNPRNKITGICPLTNKECTDVTGEHHTIVIQAGSSAEAAQAVRDMRDVHITRIEMV